MNKSIYICAAAAIMLASCSNDEVVEQAQENAISFRSMMGANTRGVVADVSKMCIRDSNWYCIGIQNKGRRVQDGTTCHL